MAQYGKNKQITDSNYDKSVAVKCVNGTFVGKKTENIIVYRGIPFVDQQPIGEWRWKAPMEYTADDGVYEAYHWDCFASRTLWRNLCPNRYSLRVCIVDFR